MGTSHAGRPWITGTVRDKDVVASAVLLDTNAVSSGLTFENRLITELPTFSSMPLLLKIDQGAQS